MNNDSLTLPTEGVLIGNAGLVILNSFFIMLFKRLEIIADKAYTSEDAQSDAVHYLQYLATGSTETVGSVLTLNKVLCGLSPYAIVGDSIEITEEQKQSIDELIKAAIDYWPATGNISLQGFRVNWLLREGLLKETEEHWELTVEKKGYDILMNRLPFSFSIIQLPWMQKSLQVIW